MATTTNYSWTTPDDTDLVKDGASAIRSLGTAIDTTVFTNAGNAIQKSIVDAKGDIIAGTADDTVARLAVGANDTVLIADSSTATGLKWGTPVVAPASASATVAANQSTSSTTYTDLVTVGPEVTITTGTKALVILNTIAFSSTTGLFAGATYEVSGATTIAADDTLKVSNGATSASRISAASRLTTLTAGSNTFTMKYKSNGATANFINREIIVIDLGS